MDVSADTNFLAGMADTNRTAFREWFIQRLEESGLSGKEVERRSGVSYDVIAKLKRRAVDSTSDQNAIRLAEGLGERNPGDLLHRLAKGQSLDVSPDTSPLGSGAPVRVENFDGGHATGMLVPVFDVHASAGFGTLVDSEEYETYSLAFPPNYLGKLTSSNPKDLAVISVKGDSMEPTLNDDDIVLLDKSKVDLSWDGLFVLRYDNALHVKRVSRSPVRGCVRIMSDNRLYDPIDLPADEVTPIGKVLWYGRKV